ncbi:L-histidine N(alpha)-methyltransferase [Sedimenticola thiotaurini]|uniref:Methyltransferase n=1 Tax=Sedimenticola thiotaurini TaxID=1543721 RepID=A0A0F7JZN5_9GAMM|nr:L-histidine N(alpha)-methyltransferase [Sedimenticola thiotaurini]AKH20804.1 methyltransferase [Sedimenticola thiotaurini]
MVHPITFHDHKPVTLNLYDAVIRGLSRTPKSIPPKFFYDERGSALFAAICEQPEYYPPDVEQAMLAELAGEIAGLTGTGRVIFEPGAGAAAKIRLLLPHLKPLAYVPMDISCEFLREAACNLADTFPGLPIHATCVDFTHSLPLPKTVPSGPRLAFFPGSSIGNFTPASARDFLAMVHDRLGPDGMLLIGVDTKKDPDILQAAYNDAAGVTAAFNLNLLRRMRDEAGLACDPAQFKHHAFYNGEQGRIEMHLVSRRAQTLYLHDHRFQFCEGESLHTENSYKYTPQEFIDLAASAGLELEAHWLGREALFALYLLRSG